MSTDTNRKYDHLLFAGTYGNVVAIDKASGQTVWQTALPKAKYMLVAILFEDDMLFCAAKGRIFALDPADGSILWSNEMPGLRYGLVYLSTAQSSRPESLMSALAQHQASARATQSATGASGTGGVS